MLGKLTTGLAAGLALVLACVLAWAGTSAAVAEPGPGPSADGAYDAALSNPVEDEFYPAHGSSGVDVLHYDLDLTWQPASRTLEGTAELLLRATRDAADFRVELASPLGVDELTVDGVPAGYHREGKNLVVEQPVVADQQATLEVSYSGSPEQVRAPVTRGDIPGLGWKTRKDGQVWAMQEPWGAYTWFPANDTPWDKALYDVRIDAPEGMVGVSNGELTDRTTSGSGRVVTTFHNDDPMASYLVTIAIGPYEQVTQTGPHGLPLSYWLPEDSPASLKRTLRQTPGIIRWLEKQLGPYPFDRAGAVVVPAASAMETQTMVTMGSRLFGYGQSYFVETLAHELAHQWYGDTVTPSQWKDLWMNEGFAMYVQARYSVHRHWSNWRSWKDAFIEDDKFLRRADGPPGRYDRDAFASRCVYYCTARMLVRLREKLGGGAFDELLAAWPQEHRNTSSSRGEYVAWVEARTRHELSRFFKVWLNSRRSPK